MTRHHHRGLSEKMTSRPVEYGSNWSGHCVSSLFSVSCISTLSKNIMQRDLDRRKQIWFLKCLSEGRCSCHGDQRSRADFYGFTTLSLFLSRFVRLGFSSSHSEWFLFDTNSPHRLCESTLDANAWSCF